jgi:adenylate kinase family enzyme
MNATIVLIGPICAGKSSAARLLAARLGLEHIELDKLRWDYYREIGYDEQMAALLKSSKPGLLDRSSYWKPFEAYAVERVVQDYKTASWIWARAMPFLRMRRCSPVCSRH